jgi:iron complex outermembrane receptor protein
MKAVLAGVLLSCVPRLLMAEAAPSPTPVRVAMSDQEEMADLLAILNEETAVATKTKTNADFVPGIVTVLSGDEMEALGFETVGEALSLVPGMQAIRNADGTPSLVVRGIDFPFNSGNVKVLVDSVPLSRQDAGVDGIALQTPIAVVERIEIIRGPGSVVYGEFALMGLVNVVTRAQGGRVLGRFGGYESLSGAGAYAWKQSHGPWAVAFTAAGLANGDMPVGLPSTVDEQRGFGTLSVKRDGLSLTVEGIARGADPKTPPPVSASQTHWTTELRYARDLAPSVHAELRATHLSNRFETGNADFVGGVNGVGLDLQWKGWRRHEWLLGLAGSFETIDRAVFRFPPPPPGANVSAPPPVTIDDENRDALSLTLQDRFDVSDRVAVTAGARFDHYSDVGSLVTPRLSFVWRASDKNILKAQYAEGFRTPTFFELYLGGFNPDLGCEVNGTSEINFVHREPKAVVRATVFHTKLRDMIFPPVPTGPGPVMEFTNGTAHARSYGAELEWEQQLHARLKAQATLSWVDAEDDRIIDDRTPRVPPPAADWIANVAVLWHASGHVLLTSRWSYVGPRHSDFVPAGADTIVDATATVRDVLADGLQLRGGVKDIFDRDPRYVFAAPNGRDLLVTYPGRTAFVQLGWSR